MKKILTILLLSAASSSLSSIAKDSCDPCAGARTQEDCEYSDYCAWNSEEGLCSYDYDPGQDADNEGNAGGKIGAKWHGGHPPWGGGGNWGGGHNWGGGNWGGGNWGGGHNWGGGNWGGGHNWGGGNNWGGPWGSGHSWGHSHGRGCGH